jgi:hypothetical protein
MILNTSLSILPNKEKFLKTLHSLASDFSLRFILLTLFLSSVALNLKGQYLISSGGTVTTCSGTFYDSGGAGGNYTQGENSIMTICSSSGEPIRLFFHDVSIRSGDNLYIYDGPDITSLLIGTYSDGISNPSPVPDFTVTSSGTCLTFRFTSDGVFDRSGWIADISCVTCPPIAAPVISPSNTEVCAGSTITYSVVDHPGSTYTWTLDDGTPVSVIDGPSFLDVTWNMSPGATGEVKVVEKDACGSTATGVLSVDIYPLPTPVISGPSEICPNTAGVVYSTPLDPGNIYNWSVTGGTYVSYNKLGTSRFR